MMLSRLTLRYKILNTSVLSFACGDGIEPASLELRLRDLDEATLYMLSVSLCLDV